MESSFGTDLGDVLIHTDSQAAASAKALGANAYTSGRNIYFAAGKYAPENDNGKRLLAHELVHTIQQRANTPSIARQRASASDMIIDPDDALEQEADRVAEQVMLSAPVGKTGPGPIAPGFRHHSQGSRELVAQEITHVMQRDEGGSQARGLIQRQPAGDDKEGDDPLTQPDQPPDQNVAAPALFYGPEYEVDVPIDDPFLPGKKKEQQMFRLHLPIQQPPLQIQFWIVPIGKLRLPKADSSKTPPAKTPPAPVTGLPSPGAPPPAHPDIPPGSVVQTFDGARLTAVASTPDHVITAKYNKYATGAASTSALKLADGSVIIIDAGVNAKGLGTTMAALESLTLAKLETFIGDGVVRELLLSHGHGDHFSLAPAILRRFAVSFIRINSVMARWSGYKALRKKLVEEEQKRIKATEEALRTEIQAERAAWQTTKGAGYAPDAREVEWQKYVKEQVDKRMAEIPGGRGASERILIQSKKNVLDVALVDLATGQKRGTLPPGTDQRASPKFGAEDPYATIRETQKPIDSERLLDQRRKTKGSDIDPYASTYVITVHGGMSLLILPDLRANDMKAIMDNFAKIMGELKRPVQVWDATHHMQRGWYSGGVPASQMAKIVDFLYAFRAKQGTDVVIVSAQADLSKPGAKTLVDPANLWLLRSLGFEAYLATSGRDVRVLDITTSQGTKLTGIVGAKAPGEGPAELSVNRAKMALEKLAAERQTHRVALKEESDATKKSEINKRISEITTLEAEIKAAYEGCLQEIAENFRKPGGHTSQSLATPPQKDFPKQRALDQLLEKHNFDRPVTTDAHLTEMALVVLNQDPSGAAPEPGSPGARARELAGVRSRLYEIDARIKAGEVTPEIQAELITELVRYRTILNNELNPADPLQKPIEGVSRTLLTDDLKSIDAKIESLKQGEGKTEYSRKLGSGEVIEQHAFVVKPLKPPPSRALVATREAADVVGRGAGLVMVITTVTGEGELMKRWSEGGATNAEAAFGSTHNITAGVVGLRMLRGVKVHPGVFVVMAALEVGEAVFRHYDTEEQRDIAVGSAEASALVNLGCMALGTAIMRIPHPATVIAGLIITFLGPLIMRVFGIDEWIERRRSFNPPEVVEVLQKLRKLITSYRVVIGSMKLAKRAVDMADPTITDRAGAKAAAEQIVKDERGKAIGLELEILKEFEEAYKDAKTNYAGFKDLDTYRAQFYYLRQDAFPGVTGAFGIRPPDAVFKAIDAKMSLDAMSEADIDDMPQWSHLENELGELNELVELPRARLDHSKIRDKDKRVQAMIDNARYRLDPSGQGHERAQPLFSKGAPIRDYYERKLAGYEASLARARYHLVWHVVPMTGVEPDPREYTALRSSSPADTRLQLDWVMATLALSVRAYAFKVESTPGPTLEMAAALFTHSEAVERYRAFLNNTPNVATGLEWLETTEQIIDGYISQAKRMLPTVSEPQDEPAKDNRKRLSDLEQQLKAARSMRYFKRGLLYKSELDNIQREVWRQEVNQAQWLFTEKNRKAPGLTEEEELALTENRSDFNPDEKVIPPLVRRLSVVRSPTAVDARGNFANIFRLTGDVQVYTDITAVLPRPEPVSPTENALVGLVGPPPPGGSPMSGGLNLAIPLNDRAIAIFKGVRVYYVKTENLSPVPATALKKARAAQVLTPSTKP
jgi:hypothetical protein